MLRTLDSARVFPLLDMSPDNVWWHAACPGRCPQYHSTLAHVLAVLHTGSNLVCVLHDTLYLVTFCVQSYDTLPFRPAPYTTEHLSGRRQMQAAEGRGRRGGGVRECDPRILAWFIEFFAHCIHTSVV